MSNLPTPGSSSPLEVPDVKSLDVNATPLVTSLAATRDRPAPLAASSSHLGPTIPSTPQVSSFATPATYLTPFPPSPLDPYRQWPPVNYSPGVPTLPTADHIIPVHPGNPALTIVGRADESTPDVPESLRAPLEPPTILNAPIAAYSGDRPRLGMSMLPFSGVEGEDVSCFLCALEGALLASGYDKKVWTGCAATWLRGPALTWFSQAKGNQWTYEEFAFELRRQFAPVRDSYPSFVALQRLRQTGSVSEYYASFKTLLSANPAFRHAPTNFYQFLDGLKPALRDRVIISVFDYNIDSAAIVARNIEAVLLASSTTLINPTISTAGFNRPSNDVVCSYCKTPGHHISMCPSPNRGKRRYDPSSQNRDSRPGRARFTTVAEDSATEVTPIPPSRVKHDYEDAMITVSVIVEGHPCRAQIDTGATTSIASSSLANLLMRNNPSRSVRAAHFKSLSEVGSGGLLSDVSIVVNGSSFTTTVFCPKKDCIDDVDLLLGMDFLRLTGASVNCITKSVTFPAAAAVESVSSIVPCEPATLDDSMLSDDSILSPSVNVSSSVDLTHLSAEIASQVRSQLNALVIEKNSSAKVTPFKIVLKPGTSPVAVRSPRTSPPSAALIGAAVQEMLDSGVIRPSTSPWASPIVLVRKKDGSIRPCVDFRPLNQLTVPDRFPIPHMDDLRDKLSSARVFTTLDLAKGYWQVPLAEDSMPLTSFVVPQGQFEFTRLPFGLRNAPSHFCRMMSTVLAGIPNVVVYLDDITVYADSITGLLEAQEQVFGRLRLHNLSLNLSKCRFMVSSAIILGRTICNGQVSADPRQLDAVKKFPIPRDVSQIRRFLGLANQYRKYIVDYASIVAPINDLLKKNAPFVWADAQNRAFSKILDTITSDPCLTLPKFDRPFLLTTDASGTSIAAELAQQDDKGLAHPIAFFSRSLNKHEVNYSVTEKEGLAVVSAVKHFSSYLTGSPVMLFTDHSALTSLISSKNLAGRLARWALILQEYDLTIKHRPGPSIAHVDALSRVVSIRSAKLSDPFADNAVIQYIRTRKLPSSLGAGKAAAIIAQAEPFHFKDGKIFTYTNGDARPKQVPPINERADIIARFHGQGHFAAKETRRRLEEIYYWPSLASTVEEFCRACIVCQKSATHPNLDHPMNPITTSAIMERVAMDLIVDLPYTLRGNRHILVIVEMCSKYPFAVALRDKTALSVAEGLWSYITMFGPPSEIMSDNGTEFANNVVTALCSKIKTSRVFTAPYNPRVNGMVERFNRTLKTTLRKLSHAHPADWDLWLDTALLAYRTRVHDSTKVTPFELMFASRPKSFETWSTPPLVAEDVALASRIVELSRFDVVRREAIRHIHSSQLRQARAFDSSTKRNIITSPIPINSRVLLVDHKRASSLHPFYLGPYVVIDVSSKNQYVIQDPRTGEILGPVPVNHLILAQNPLAT